MKRNLFVLVLVLYFLLMGFSRADIDTGWPCTSDQSCRDDLGGGSQAYVCNLTTKTCFLVENASNSSGSAPAPAPLPPPTDLATMELQQDLATLRTEVQQLQETLNRLEQEDSSATS